MLALGPEPNATAGAGPPGAARTLRGRRATDPPQLEPVEPAAGIDAGIPPQAAVDHGRDPIDGQRRLRDVRGQDNLALLTRPQSPVLVDSSAYRGGAAQ